MLTHVAIVFTAVLTPCSGVSLPTNHFGVSLLTFAVSDRGRRFNNNGIIATATVWPSASDWLLRGLCPNWLTLCSGLTNVPRSLFQSRRLSRAQLFLWFLRQNRKRYVFWTLRRCFKEARDKLSSLATHPQTYKETHTYTSIYIYIYIYIHECSLSCHSCSVDSCVVCLLFGHRFKSFFSLFYVTFESSYRCIDALSNSGESSSSFSWYI